MVLSALFVQYVHWLDELTGFKLTLNLVVAQTLQV